MFSEKGPEAALTQHNPCDRFRCFQLPPPRRHDYTNYSLGVFSVLAGASSHDMYAMTAKMIPQDFLHVMAGPFHYTQKIDFPDVISGRTVDYMRLTYAMNRQ